MEKDNLTYQENVTEFAVSKNYVEKITLHNKEYYNALNDGIFAFYNKIHCKGESIYAGSVIPFLNGKKIGQYQDDIYGRWFYRSHEEMINDDVEREYTTDDMINVVKDKLSKIYGDNQVELTDKKGVLLIHPHIVIVCKDKKDNIIKSFNTYKEAKRYYNRLKFRLKLIS